MVAELHNRRVVRVPEVLGLPLKKARILVEDAGLAIDAVLFRESYEDRDTVLDQRPARGQMVYEGTEVTLWIARRGYMRAPARDLPPLRRGRPQRRARHLLPVRAHVRLDRRAARRKAIATTIRTSARPGSSTGWPRGRPWSWTSTGPRPRSGRSSSARVDLYRIRGTKRGLALFLKLFTGHEPHIEENEWPFKGFRVGGDARIGIDSVMLPPVERAHCFIVTMPVKFDGRIAGDGDPHPSASSRWRSPHTRTTTCASRPSSGDVELRDFFAIGLRSGIGIGAEVVEPLEAAESTPSLRPGAQDQMSDKQQRKGYKRINFFKGFLTTEKDWNDAERYHIDKRKLHNRLLARSRRGARLRRRSPGRARAAATSRSRCSRATPSMAWATTWSSSTRRSRTSTPRSSGCRRRSTSCCASTRSSPTSSRTRRISSTRAIAACSRARRVELSQTEPDIHREIELGRIYLEKGATRVRDARDPPDPRANEIDMRFVPRAGIAGSYLLAGAAPAPGERAVAGAQDVPGVLATQRDLRPRRRAGLQHRAHAQLPPTWSTCTTCSTSST